MRHLILADNQAITRLGVKYLALEAGRELSSIKEAVGLQELSMLLSSIRIRLSLLTILCSIVRLISFGY